ncbi:TetR family transcriptional regulator C-terminal domain-containing protein [Pseudogemmobacter faecipullorum]|uniref:TetR family transcriptional regulator n=1 Tax=Pseudogemmobacter faecipullorum TaxID=2755041 RepID=A0ABS8CNT2_9RHOB|nr:TetR family transcriptional regulator [Pseudogemmobacter faecipullorum]MCB5411023.1 TetR family transcriptional regulator [Pseudogemmobacter faecipullorum]
MNVVRVLVTSEGLAAATVRRIAQELGCSPGQIHHHFASAEALRAEAVRDVWARIEPILSAALAPLPPRQRLLIVLASCVEYLPDDMQPAMIAAKRLWREARDAHPGPEVRDAVAEGLGRLRSELETTLRRGIAEGEFPAGLDVRKVLLDLMTATIGYDNLTDLGAVPDLTGDKRAFIEERMRQHGL